MTASTISKELIAALNEQMAKEAHLSQTYLSYGGWADAQGFSGIANFLFGNAQREHDHMMKILGYILDNRAKICVTGIPAPPEDPTDINSCFEKILVHNADNSRALLMIEKICFTENDWTTWNFIQWLVKDMGDEERVVRALLEEFRRADDSLNDKVLFSLN